MRLSRALSLILTRVVWATHLLPGFRASNDKGIHCLGDGLIRTKIIYTVKVGFVDFNVKELGVVGKKLIIMNIMNVTNTGAILTYDVRIFKYGV